MSISTNMPTEPWIDTTAKVTSCRFQFAGLGSLAFGVNLSGKFRISFDYRAHGRLYSDEFQSPIAIPQDTELPISYNPLDPAENSRTHNPSAAISQTPPIWLIGIGGSIVVSLIWLAALRSCH